MLNKCSLPNIYCAINLENVQQNLWLHKNMMNEAKNQLQRTVKLIFAIIISIICIQYLLFFQFLK